MSHATRWGALALTWAGWLEAIDNLMKNEDWTPKLQDTWWYIVIAGERGGTKGSP